MILHPLDYMLFLMHSCQHHVCYLIIIVLIHNFKGIAQLRKEGERGKEKEKEGRRKRERERERERVHEKGRERGEEGEREREGS